MVDTKQIKMILERYKVEALIEQGQKRGLTGKDVIDALIRKGYEPEGVNVQGIKQKMQPVQAPEIQTPKKNLGDYSADAIIEGVSKISSSIQGAGQKYQEGVAQGGVGGVLKSTGGLLEGALGTTSGFLQTIFSPLTAVLNQSSDKLAETPVIKELADSRLGDAIAKGEEGFNEWTKNNPRLATNLFDSLNVGLASLGGNTKLTLPKFELPRLSDFKTFKPEVPPGGGGGGGGGSLSTVSDNALKVGTELKNNVQLAIAKKNVSPQLESSANRLFLDGTKNLESPLATYDKYLAQSKNALKDIKTDPAISVVGEKMGNAFETVVKQRQAVGKILGDELKLNGKIKISIIEPKTNLLAELKDSGLSYNPKTGKLTSFQGSKFATDEVKMLNDFVRGVNKLGDNPTVAQIDNFISKTRSDLAFTKGKSGVIGTTNAERIINGGISKLRATLDPAVNGNSALTKYWNANKTYSELSDFVDEGSTFLGKKTLTGDYAKDASVAKSSVQSILNQGKKDFMIKLEALTGYKAIDDAVLALQAMKDAGDFRGLSLLQAMSETGIPTSKAGITQKILDYALSKGGEFIAGTPEEQTRALLQSLENNLVKPTTVNPTSKTTPKTGAKISKRNQPKSSKTVILT